MKVFIVFLFCLGLISAASAERLAVECVAKNGKSVVTEVSLVFTERRASYRLAKDAIPHGTQRIVLRADFATARAGEDGYWVFPSGHLGKFNPSKKDLSRRLPRPNMPFFGMKTPRGTWVALVKGMPFNFSLTAEVRQGVYAVYPSFDLFIDEAYEDIVIEWIKFADTNAGYADMARAYRRYQLDRKEVLPLSERAKKSPELAYAARWPEVRVRHAWKPVPSPKPDQTVKDEPPVKPVITFDRFKDIVSAFKKAGIGGAEFCLVGWNVGGHDGRWPQIFPVEPSLGGEAKLKASIRFARDNGFQVVAHGNHRDAYLIADAWDAEYIIEKNADGTLRRPKTTWGGGRMYTICPKRAYERFAVKDMAMVSAMGFRGLHYLDVFSCVGVPRCVDPRHPLNERDAAAWTGHILQLSRDAFGGSASEGSYDQNAGQLDSVLYVSFDRPFEKMPPMVDRLVPMFQLVYNGIILSNPFTTTVNAVLKGRADELKLIEFGGRPTFYYYANFLTPGKGKNWMGDTDMVCGTDAELDASVSAVARGIADYAKLWECQYAFMDDHAEVLPGVFRTSYSNGTRIYVNYTKASVSVDGISVRAEDWSRAE